MSEEGIERRGMMVDLWRRTGELFSRWIKKKKMQASRKASGVMELRMIEEHPSTYQLFNWIQHSEMNYPKPSMDIPKIQYGPIESSG